MKRIGFALAILVAVIAPPAEAQIGPRFSVQPYVGYGFYGTLPGGGRRLEAAVAYGGRAAFQISEQFALFGNFQRSQPKLGPLTEAKATVDHWSTGVEFSFVPRGGAEGMLPILLEAGLGQTRYDWAGSLTSFEAGESDFAVNLGIASALELSPNFAIRYGVNDYLSNYAERGITNQVFVQVGAELKF